MLTEGAQLVGESGKTYLAVSSLGQANVWTAVDSVDYTNIVVIKEPGADDTKPGWHNFQNEMIMHELFKNSNSIRKQVDRIPPVNQGDPPMLVLEITETTLWTARTKRPFTSAELKTVCKATLVGLADVHARGLVYADLKMQNIMLDGFNVNDPAKEVNAPVAKLGDLGIVMEPAQGKVQPVSYRAPEVYFKKEITSKADIWGWGLIYCHLLEAQTRFSKTGIYDDLDTGHGTMVEREEAVQYAISNDYKIEDEPYFQGIPLPPDDTRKHKGDQWEELRQRGLQDGEVDFLRWVMRADPRKRPSAVQILRCGWLDKTDKGVAAGFHPPVNPDGRPSMEFDPRRSEPIVPTLRQQARVQTGEESHGRHSTPDKEIASRPPTISRATMEGRAPNTMIDDALAEAYASRGTYKRNHSHTTEGEPMVKKTYLSEAHPESSPSRNSRLAQNSTEDANSSSPVVPAPSQTRPGISTQNTGTFLSYR